jgi:hypothetical protein
VSERRERAKALELVVQDDALDAGATFLKPRSLALICAIDLHVMLDLPCLLRLGIELLSRVVEAWPTTRAAAISVAPVGREQIAPTLGEDHGDVAAAIDRNRPHESLFAEMSQVAPARVEWPPVAIAQVA